MKTIVIDIETIPDIAGHERAGIDPKAGFPPFPLHEIACVSVLTVETHDFGSLRFRIETLSRADNSERGIICELEQIVAGANEVVTYNGRGFDVPVLLARAALAEECTPYIARLHSRAHAGFHADLLDQVTAFGAAPRLKLAHLCAAFDIPVKIDTDGSEVATLASRGEWSRITRYCETDVVATWLVAQLWTGTQIPGYGRERWEALSAWILCEQPRLAHLVPYAAVPTYPRGGQPLGHFFPNL